MGVELYSYVMCREQFTKMWINNFTIIIGTDLMSLQVLTFTELVVYVEVPNTIF